MQIAQKEDEFASREIKAIMSLFTDVLVETNKPSEGEFNSDVKEYITRVCQLLQENNTPVWFDILPIYSVKQLFNNDLEFAFFDNKSPSSSFMDGDNKYNNIFEVMYDTFIYALKKVGISNMSIIVTQMSSPTDGTEGTSLENGHRLLNGFIKHILEEDKGTPFHHGPINAFLYNLVDEFNLKTRRGDFIRHLGLYRKGSPKYSLDVFGQGREYKLVSIKGWLY